MFRYWIYAAGEDPLTEPNLITTACGCILANESMRPSKLHRHIDTNRPETKNKPLEFYQRKLESLTISKNNIFNFNAIKQKAVYASYKMSLRIA